METGQSSVVKDENSSTQTTCRTKQRMKISNPYIKNKTVQILTSNSTEETNNVCSRKFVTRGGTFTVSKNHPTKKDNDLLSKPNSEPPYNSQHNQTTTQPIQLPAPASVKSSLNNRTSSSKPKIEIESTQRPTKISNPYLRKPKSITKSFSQNLNPSNRSIESSMEREKYSSSMHRNPPKNNEHQNHQSTSQSHQVSVEISNDNTCTNRNSTKSSKKIHNPSRGNDEHGCMVDSGRSLSSQSLISEVTETSFGKVSGIKRDIDAIQTNQMSEESHKIRRTLCEIQKDLSSDAEIHKCQLGIQGNHQQSPEILECKSNYSHGKQSRNDPVINSQKPFLCFKKMNSPTKYQSSRGAECKERSNLENVSEYTEKKNDLQFISVSKITSKGPADEYKSTNYESLRPQNNIQLESKPTSKCGFVFPDPCSVDKNHSEPSRTVSINKFQTESNISTKKNAHSNEVGSKATTKEKDPLKNTVDYSHLSRLPTLPDDLAYAYNRIAPVNDEFKKELIKNANLSGEFKNGWKLLPHQKQGILRAILMRRIVLAFDMGLGKTLIACVWAQAFQKTFEQLNVFVISPVSLKKEWERTAKDVVGLRVKDDGKTRKAKPPKKSSSKLSKETEIDLTGDQSDDMSECTGLLKSPPIEIFSWAKIPSRVSSDIEKFIVICDEAHSMQNMDSIRTKGALKLINDKR